MRFLLFECYKVWQTEGMEISGVSGLLHIVGEVERSSLLAQSSSLTRYLWLGSLEMPLVRRSVPLLSFEHGLKKFKLYSLMEIR